MYKGTYYKTTKKLDIGPLMFNEVPIRIFLLQESYNNDKDWGSIGMVVVKNNPNDIKVFIKDVFESIPDIVTKE